MRTNTRSGLIALAIAAPMVAGAALLSNAPALGGQFLLSPPVLMAEAETTEQDGMMGQGGMGGMGGMMNRGEMDQGEMGGMGGMMNMMQQMSSMMETCNEMMEAHAQHEREPGNAAEPEGEPQ